MSVVRDKVNVLFVLPPSRHFAGVERVVHEVADSLSRQMLDQMTVAVAMCSEYDQKRGAYRSIDLGVDRLRGLPTKLAKLLATEEFDVLVCPQIEPSVMASLALLLSGSNAQLIPHLHGNPLVERAGSWRSAMLFFLFQKMVAPHIPFAFAVSRELAKVAESYLRMPGRVHHVPNPVRQLSVTHGAVGERDVFRFVSVGRLARQKGHDVLLSAFAKVLEEEPNVTLKIAGEGPERAALERLAYDLGLTGKCDFLGHVQPDGLFGESDCFVIASRWEGFPLVLGEAMSAGLAIVATDCQFGPSELVDDAQVGELCPVENPIALSKAMLRAVRNPNIRSGREYRKQKAAAYAPDLAAMSHGRLILQAAGR